MNLNAQNGKLWQLMGCGNIDSKFRKREEVLSDGLLVAEK